jgi:hypothetical protein
LRRLWQYDQVTKTIPRSIDATKSLFPIYIVDPANQHPSSSFGCCGFDNSADTASSVVDIEFVEPTKGKKHVSSAFVPKICSSNIRDRYSPRVLKINMVLISEESDLFHR